jgi:hypothetical protein
LEIPQSSPPESKADGGCYDLAHAASNTSSKRKRGRLTSAAHHMTHPSLALRASMVTLFYKLKNLAFSGSFSGGDPRKVEFSQP